MNKKKLNTTKQKKLRGININSFIPEAEVPNLQGDNEVTAHATI